MTHPENVPTPDAEQTFQRQHRLRWPSDRLQALRLSLCLLLLTLAGVGILSCVACQHHAQRIDTPRALPQRETPRAAPRPAQINEHPGPALASINGEPRIRVRVQAASNALTLGNPNGSHIILAPPPEFAETVQAHRYAAPITISHSAQGFTITDGQRRTVRWDLPHLIARADPGEVLQLGDRQYPHELVIHWRSDGNGSPAGRVDAINHVPMETYLAGVIEHELYPQWGLEAYRAQCIAARSYAFWEMKKNARRHFDLESTTASQVYGGRASNPTALQAVQSTRGMVVVFDRHVVPCFYSSTSAGVGADAHTTFDDFPAYPPLTGKVHGNWSRQSTSYSWTLSRNTNHLSHRIAAWGRGREHPVAGLQQLRQIEVAQTNSVGYPIQFTLHDARGGAYAIRASDFRLACNYTHPAVPDITRQNRLKSTFVQINVTGQSVTFQGRGFGHGVGLCQWSAQAMSQAGHTGEAILHFFYPHTSIQRAY